MEIPDETALQLQSLRADLEALRLEVLELRRGSRVAAATAAPSPPPPEVLEQLPKEFEPVSIAEIERVHIQDMLIFTEGNKARAARLLGITAATLYNKLKVYSVQQEVVER